METTGDASTSVRFGGQYAHVTALLPWNRSGQPASAGNVPTNPAPVAREHPGDEVAVVVPRQPPSIRRFETSGD